MADHGGFFCVILCRDEMTFTLNNRSKICINKNHQIFIDCRKDSLSLLTSGEYSKIIVSMDIISSFISSFECDSDDLTYTLKNNNEIFQVDCHDINIFNLALEYSNIQNPTKEERYCARNFIYLVLSFFAKNKNFIPLLINSINNSITFKVQETIKRNVSHEWSLDKVASILCMSSSSLKKHLKTEGTSYNKIIVQCRMQHAANILSVNRDIMICQLATLCGYSHLSYFIYAFKKIL